MRRAVLWYSVRNRNRKADAITAFLARESAVGLILVGISPARQRNEGILERRLAEQTDILSACDILPCPSSPWPFVQTDARQLPYRDRAAGCVVSNAVIEHVGGLEDQRAFVAEHQRVGEAWVITTPNRWFPVESHTSVLFRHWSPRWRAARPEFTRLLSRREFLDLLPPTAVVSGRPWSSTFIAFHAAVPA